MSNVKILKTDTFDTWRLGTNENGRRIGDIDLLSNKVTRYKATVKNNSSPPLSLTAGDTITGDITGATGLITSVVDDNTFYVTNVVGSFADAKNLKTVIHLSGGVAGDFVANDLFETATHTNKSRVFSWDSTLSNVMLFGDVSGLAIGDTITSANTTSGLTIVSIAYESVDTIGETVTVAGGVSGSFEVVEINRDIIASINQMVDGQIISLNANGVSFSSDTNSTKVIFGDKKVEIELSKDDANITEFRVDDLSDIEGTYTYSSGDDWWYNSVKGLYGYHVIYDTAPSPNEENFIISTVNNWAFGNDEDTILYRSGADYASTEYPWNRTDWKSRDKEIIVTGATSINGTYEYLSAEDLWRYEVTASHYYDIVKSSSNWNIIETLDGSQTLLYVATAGASVDPDEGTVGTFIYQGSDTAGGTPVLTASYVYNAFTQAVFVPVIFSSGDIAVDDAVSQVVAAGETVTGDVFSADATTNKIVLYNIVESNGLTFANTGVTYPASVFFASSSPALEFDIVDVLDAVTDPHIRYTPATNSFTFEGTGVTGVDFSNLTLTVDKIQNGLNYVDLLNSDTSVYVDGSIESTSGTLTLNGGALTSNSSGAFELRTNAGDFASLSVGNLTADTIVGNVTTSSLATQATNSTNVGITSLGGYGYGWLAFASGTSGNKAIKINEKVWTYDDQIVSKVGFEQRDSMFKISKTVDETTNYINGISFWYDEVDSCVKAYFQDGVKITTSDAYLSSIVSGSYILVNTNTYQRLGDTNTQIILNTATNRWTIYASDDNATISFPRGTFVNGGKYKVTPSLLKQKITLDTSTTTVSPGDQINDGTAYGWVIDITVVTDETDGTSYDVMNLWLKDENLFTVTTSLVDSDGTALPDITAVTDGVTAETIFNFTANEDLIGSIETNIIGDLTGNSNGVHSGSLNVVDASITEYGSTKHYPIFGTAYDDSAAMHGDTELFYVPTEHKLGAINVAINSTTDNPGYLTINSQYGDDGSETRYQGWEGTRMYHDPGNSLEDTGILKIEKRVNASTWTKATIDASYFTGTAEYANVAREAIGVVNDLTLNQDQDIIYTEEFSSGTIDYLEEKMQVYTLTTATSTGASSSPPVLVAVGDIINSAVTVSSVVYNVEFYVKSITEGGAAVIVQRNYNTIVDMTVATSPTFSELSAFGVIAASTTNGTYIKSELEIRAADTNATSISATCLSDAFRLKAHDAAPIELAIVGTVVCADGVSWDPGSQGVPHPVFYNGSSWVSMV